MVIEIQKYYQETQLFFATELCSKIIQSMQQDGSVVLRTKEARSAQVNGLYQLLDDLCSYWQWDPKNITLETTNFLEQHPRYNIVHIHYDNMLLLTADAFKLIRPRAWNKEKMYGMFIGRANATRMRGLHNHLNFEYRDLGLTSFHHDMKYHVDQATLLEYLMQSNQPYNEAVNVAPYSDIDTLFTPPITEPANIIGWESVYEKIGIELVFQTDPFETAMPLGEKWLRPMLYKRPFLLVAGRNYIKNINSSWSDYVKTLSDTPETRDLLNELKECQRNKFRFFDRAINLAYDQDEGIYRVDHVFDILRELIAHKKIDQLLDICAEDIEHNYNTAIEMGKILSQISKHQRSFFPKEFDGPLGR